MKEGLRDLYEKAKREQWNGSTELDWSQSVEPRSEIVPEAMNPLQDYGPFRHLDAEGRARFRHASLAWQLSQFLYGEQGALITASQLVAAVPWIDAKHYAATQTMDAARHVEVFSRYVREKLEWEFPIDANLKRLLDIILLDERWDFKYLGMQVLVAGLAMAAFSNLYQLAQELLLKRLIHAVMRDDFVIEACQLMRDRLVGDQVAEVMGFDRDEVRALILASPIMQAFRQGLFARVVPNIKRLGLLTPRVGEAFDAMGVLQFADLDPEAADLALGL